MERAKSFIKSAFPASVRIYRRLKRAGRLKFRAPVMTDIFSDIYRNRTWEDGGTISGRGSTLARTEVIRRELPRLLESVVAESLLDAPCGDFNWMRHVDLGALKYIGADVVPELIERNRRRYESERRAFVVLDITADELPSVDVIICRDCFIHLSFRDIRAAVSNFKRSGSEFLLATTHAHVAENTDTETGGLRSVNLRLPPFDFPAPSRSICEDAETGKYLGLWRLEQL